MAGSWTSDARRTSRRATVAWIALACGLIGACGTGSGPQTGSSQPPGTLALNPATQLRFVVDTHAGGKATRVKLVTSYWGRMVDVFDFDAASQTKRLILRDFVIGDDIQSDGVDYLLARDAFTDRETVTILHPEGSAEFAVAFHGLDLNAQRLLDKGLDPAELPPFSAVPRNAVLVLALDDLLDDGGNPGDPDYPRSVDQQTVRLFAGYPPSSPFEARVLPDPTHGDLVEGVFHSTRVLIDFAVSELEALESSSPVNALGLPTAQNAAQPNVVVRVPTRVDSGAGQFRVLTNLDGKALAFDGNGHGDPTAPTLDVLRAFRSRGRNAVTGDPFNGFLPDALRPSLVAEQAVTMTHVDALGGDALRVDYLFATPACAVAPRDGDLIELPTHWLQVTGDQPAAINGASASDVRVRAIHGDPALVPLSNAAYRTRFVPAQGDLPACFAQLSPAPVSLPNIGASTDSTLIVRFSEPIDPASARALETLSLRCGDPPSGDPLYRRVVGSLEPSADLRRFAFSPSFPLRHDAGEATPYALEIVSGAAGLTDLAGNPLDVAIPQIPFTLRPDAPAVDSGGIVLSFAGLDENGDGAPELRGQVLIDLAREKIGPRAVTRFSAEVDPGQPTVGAMKVFPQPIQTPLSNHGSRTMGVWRYHDTGFALLDETNHNIDVESLHWQPFSGGLFVDHFSNFQLSLSHCFFLPDDAVSTALLPLFPQSGLVRTFEENLLDPIEDAPAVMHSAALPYQVDPIDLFSSVNNNKFAPWPVNRGVPMSQFHYWTWRDTAKLAVGGPFGAGANTQRLQQLSGLGLVGFYPPGAVPTIGLPMLMEFRTWPDTKASGLNGFKVALALLNSPQPFFRVFSTGGVDPTNPLNVKTVVPSNEPLATGGINPNPAPGQPIATPPDDNVFYFGQADFVVRVSRAHTAWFDLFSASEVAEPLLEPGAGVQPLGTQVLVALRGASSIQAAPGTPWRDASNLDPYGDSFTAAQLVQLGAPASGEFAVSFTAGDRRWVSQASALDHPRFVQARISFLANAQSGVLPSLDAFGLAYRRSP